jgi:hypothetical protein
MTVLASLAVMTQAHPTYYPLIGGADALVGHAGDLASSAAPQSMRRPESFAAVQHRCPAKARSFVPDAGCARRFGKASRSDDSA